jgi:mannose-6-phosphate isomerase-like protein (cupin superfamily)
MIIQGNELETVRNRKDYKIGPMQDALKHFVMFYTTPENPFGPHKHDGAEFWYIIEGEGVVVLDGEEHAVQADDLIYLAPWSHHGLRTESRVRWICMG